MIILFAVQFVLPSDPKEREGEKGYNTFLSLVVDTIDNPQLIMAALGALKALLSSSICLDRNGSFLGLPYYSETDHIQLALREHPIETCKGSQRLWGLVKGPHSRERIDLKGHAYHVMGGRTTHQWVWDHLKGPYRANYDGSQDPSSSSFIKSVMAHLTMKFNNQVGPHDDPSPPRASSSATTIKTKDKGAAPGVVAIGSSKKEKGSFVSSYVVPSPSAVVGIDPSYPRACKRLMHKVILPSLSDRQWNM